MASESYNVYWFVVACVQQPRKIINLHQYKVTKFKICPCRLQTHMSPRVTTNTCHHVLVHIVTLICSPSCMVRVAQMTQMVRA